MAENLELGLLCTETINVGDDDMIFGREVSNFQMGFPLESEEIIREMMETEKQHLPSDDYIRRLRSGDMDFNARRRKALNWIFKVWFLFYLLNFYHPFDEWSGHRVCWYIWILGLCRERERDVALNLWIWCFFLSTVNMTFIWQIYYIKSQGCRSIKDRDGGKIDKILMHLLFLLQ